MAKSASLYTSEGIRDWLRACRFQNDLEAAAALGVAFRSFGRWKSLGLPRSTPASAIYSSMIVQKMQTIFKERNGK